MCCSIASIVMDEFSPKAFSTLSPFRLRKGFQVSVRKQASPASPCCSSMFMTQPLEKAGRSIFSPFCWTKGL